VTGRRLVARFPEVVTSFGRMAGKPEVIPLCPEMYGPPQDCKGKFGREDKSAQMYSAFLWRITLLAMMSCARVCPSKSVGR